MAKARVSSLAKELGIPSRTLIDWLNNHGEAVRTPSSTIESSVVSKVYATFADSKTIALPAATDRPVVFSSDDDAGKGEWVIEIEFVDGDKRWLGDRFGSGDFSWYKSNAIRFESRAAALNRGYDLREQRRSVAAFEVVRVTPSGAQAYSGSGRA